MSTAAELEMAYQNVIILLSRLSQWTFHCLCNSYRITTACKESETKEYTFDFIIFQYHFILFFFRKNFLIFFFTKKRQKELFFSLFNSVGLKNISICVFFPSPSSKQKDVITLIHRVFFERIFFFMLNKPDMVFYNNIYLYDWFDHSF